MMDEQLIDEVAQHSVIYNRQKYYLNGSGGNSGVNKFETKDDAWQIIAMRLRSDVETCKKRWKYLRERYVSQRKQGDPPVYEHLSRPYLEKMKFLDQHIQPRKSYRSMPNYLTSPHSANSSFNGDYSMDAKSNGSHKSLNTGHYAGNNHHYNHAQQQPDAHAMDSGNSHVKIEADQMFRDFAAAVASQQLHQHQVAAVAAAIADSSQNYQEHFRETTTSNGLMSNANHNGGSSGGLASSSSIKSSLASPLSGTNAAALDGNITNATASQQNTAHSSPSSTSCANAAAAAAAAAVHTGYAEVNNDDLDSTTGCNYNMKKPRVQLSSGGSNCHNNSNSNNMSNHNNNMNGHGNSFGATDTDDDSDDNSSSLMKPQNFNEHATNPQSSNNTLHSVGQRANATNNTNQFASNAELLFQLYQQLPQQQQSQLSSGAFHQQQAQHQHYNKFQMPAAQNATVERSSEQLLGELVTTELLSMPKERRKKVQKRILEILFFEDS